MPLREIAYRVAAPAAWCDQLETATWTEVARQTWIIRPKISTHHQLAHTLLAEHGVEPQRIVEADQETVVGSLVVSGVGMALIREDIALQYAEAGEVCLWDGIRIPATVWFVYLRERENDPILRSLLDVLAGIWNG
jgi:DNA-binding transcriptional LysR family regulator